MAVGDQNLAERIEQIYEESYPAFCRLATGVTSSVETARDAVQEDSPLRLRRRIVQDWSYDKTGKSFHVTIGADGRLVHVGNGPGTAPARGP